jgi:hypothetical protein
MSFNSEQIAQLVELGVLSEEEAALQTQMAAARAIREGKGPEGRSYGGVYTAAHPLEHIAHMLRQRRAQGEIDMGDRRMGEIRDKRQKVRAMYGNTLMGNDGTVSNTQIDVPQVAPPDLSGVMAPRIPAEPVAPRKPQKTDPMRYFGAPNPFWGG